MILILNFEKIFRCSRCVYFFNFVVPLESLYSQIKIRSFVFGVYSAEHLLTPQRVMDCMPRFFGVAITLKSLITQQESIFLVENLLYTTKWGVSHICIHTTNENASMCVLLIISTLWQH